MGNPRRAILRLSLPMILAMSVQTLYNFVDAIWVSGIGANALAAVGFFFPFHFMIMALATGIGVGGSAAVSRRIGAEDREGARHVANHTYVLMLGVSLLITLPAVWLAPRIFAALGAGPVTPMASGYGRIMFAATLIVFFNNIASALLRGEGDVRRVMNVMLLGAGINIFLDPVFIYLLGLGVNGAAWATVVSMVVSAIILFFWIYIRKSTWVSVSYSGFRIRKGILHDILRVGLPSTVQHMAMSFSMFLLNAVAVTVGGTDGVAVLSTGWRVATFAILPLMGIATAVTSVTGAAFGGRDIPRLKAAFHYAIRIGLMIELAVAAATFLLAEPLARIFTLSEESFRLRPDLIVFIRTMCIYYPATAFGMLSSAMFQGTGKGLNALAVTVFRTLVMSAPMAWLLAVIFQMGLPGLWWGVVSGNITGAVVAYAWARWSIGHMPRDLV